MQAQNPSTTAVDEVTQHQPVQARLWCWLPHDLNWLAAAVQLPGTLFFNVSTVAAVTHNATAAESDRYVWRPDLYGSVLFLVASACAVLAVSSRFLSVQPRSFPWRIAWLNMLGSVFFMASAIASYVVPSTDQVLSTRIAVAGTFWGAVCFLVGAALLLPAWRRAVALRHRVARRPGARRRVGLRGDVHVVWEKFCRYFDVEARIVPLQPGKYTIGPEDVAPHVDENTIGVAAVLGTTFTGHKDDIVGINDLLVQMKRERDLDVPLHVDGASGGFVWPFLYPDSPWDFRLEQVRSINVSGHKFGLVYPGIGWLIFREVADLAPDLVFKENYLGKTDSTFTLNFSTGSAMASQARHAAYPPMTSVARSMPRSWSAAAARLDV